MTEFLKDPNDPYRKVAGFVWHVQVMDENMEDTTTSGPSFHVTGYWNPSNTFWQVDLGFVSLTKDGDWEVYLMHAPDNSRRFGLQDFKGIYQYLRERVLGMPIYELDEAIPYQRRNWATSLDVDSRDLYCLYEVAVSLETDD